MPAAGSDECTYEEYVHCPNVKQGMSTGANVGLHDRVDLRSLA
jgi:hypothetical protein